MSKIGNNYINNTSSEIKKLLQGLTSDELNSFMSNIDDDERDSLMYNWDIWARDKQLEYRNKMFITLARCGRGFGKTRMSSEAMLEWERSGYKNFYISNINPGSCRDINIMGESGILACAPPWNKPVYLSSKACIMWNSGAKALMLSGSAYEQARGKQCEKAVLDELFAYQYPEELYDMVAMGCRLGDNPQILITSTPKTTEFMRKLLKDKRCHVISGSTFENKNHLADSFIETMEEKYGNTRLGRQELYGELIDDNPNAAFNREYINQYRVDRVDEDLKYTVVSVDPSTSSKDKSNLTGIIVAGLGESKHGYVLEDCTTDGAPEHWGKAVVEAYSRHEADCILYEDNQGGLMVEAVIHAINPDIVCKPIHASKSKSSRAEPVSIKYQKGLVHHVGCLSYLEDQMVDWSPGDTSPDRMDAMVHAMTYLLINNLSTQAPIIPGATGIEGGTFTSVNGGNIFTRGDVTWKI